MSVYRELRTAFHELQNIHHAIFLPTREAQERAGRGGQFLIAVWMGKEGQGQRELRVLDVTEGWEDIPLPPGYQESDGKTATLFKISDRAGEQRYLVTLYDHYDYTAEEVARLSIPVAPPSGDGHGEEFGEGAIDSGLVGTETWTKLDLTPGNLEGASYKVGGEPRAVTRGAWPHYSDDPLRYLGSLSVSEGVLDVFIGAQPSQVGSGWTGYSPDSWEAEDQANAVVLNGTVVPRWIEMRPVGASVPTPRAMQEMSLLADEALPLIPDWVQSEDEAPEGGTFLGQFTSDDNFMIGDMGSAYVYATPTDESAPYKVFWQSA